MTLNPEQRAVLNDIGGALKEDFTLRRRMLLKRVDVTLQSFLWAEKAQGGSSDGVRGWGRVRVGFGVTSGPRRHKVGR